MTDRELLEKAIYWFRVIAEDMEKITSGNLPHCAATTKGRAIRAYEFLEKHREPVSEILKEAAEQYAFRTHAILMAQTIAMDSFKAGAEWQKEQDQSTIELAEDHAMLAGMEKMKEQIMKNAIELEVKKDAGGYPYIDCIELYDYDKDVPLAKKGDKYKVILIKE